MIFKWFLDDNDDDEYAPEYFLLYVWCVCDVKIIMSYKILLLLKEES